MKALIKYSLSLSILVLGLYSQVPAHADKESALYSSQKNINWLEYANLCALQYYRHLIIKSSSSSAEKENCQLDVAENEVEEYELVSSKKNVDSNNCAASFFLPEMLAGLFNCDKKALLLNSYFTHAASCRYIRFQVFRI